MENNYKQPLVMPVFSLGISRRVTACCALKKAILLLLFFMGSLCAQAQNLSVFGADKVIKGETYTYYISGSYDPNNYSWGVFNGQVIAQDAYSIQIQWLSTGWGSVSFSSYYAGDQYAEFYVSIASDLPMGATFNHPYEAGMLAAGVSFSRTDNNHLSLNYENDYGQPSDDIIYRFSIQAPFEYTSSRRKSFTS